MIQEKPWAPIDYIAKLPVSHLDQKIPVWYYAPRFIVPPDPIEELETGPPWLEPVLMAAIIVVVVVMLVVTIFVWPHPVKS